MKDIKIKFYTNYRLYKALMSIKLSFLVTNLLQVLIHVMHEQSKFLSFFATLFNTNNLIDLWLPHSIGSWKYFALTTKDA